MYEYRIVNRKTEEETVIFGRTYAQACAKWKVNPNDYFVLDSEYMD